MIKEISLDMVIRPSENVVARVIEGELIIVPLTGDMGDLEDALFTLNETGQEIWSCLDGHNSLREIAEELAISYDAEPGEIEGDLLGLIGELYSREMVVVLSPK